MDLHWGITRQGFSFPLDPERLWEQLEPVSLGGKDLLTLPTEDLLLILCVHGGKHLWERLGWICDIADLIRIHKGMEWRRVMEQARALRSERMLFLGLYLASDLLEISLPEEASQRVQADPVVRSLAARVRERLFRESNDPRGILESWLFHIRVRERLRDGCRYCLSLVMTPTGIELTLLPLPTLLYPLYYLLRPMRLLAKHGGSMLKHVWTSL